MERDFSSSVVSRKMEGAEPDPPAGESGETVEDTPEVIDAKKKAREDKLAEQEKIRKVV